MLLDKAIAGCLADEVAEIRSLGKTLASWRTEILAHHDTGASNGPTEGLNLCVKKVKRCGHGFRTFEHYRLRVLLHAGGVTWPARPRPPRHPNPRSPLRRVGPVNRRRIGACIHAPKTPPNRFGEHRWSTVPRSACGQPNRPVVVRGMAAHHQ